MTEFGGTKEELIATVRMLRQNNEYESRIKANQILELQQENKSKQELINMLKDCCFQNQQIIKEDMNAELSMYQKGELTGNYDAFEDILNLIKEYENETK